VIGQTQADVTLPALSATRVGTFGDAQLLHGADPRKTFAVFELSVEGKPVSRSLVFFDAAKNLALPVPRIHTRLARTDDGYTLALDSDALAREVWISFGDLDAQISDNAIDLLPDQRVVVRVRSKAGLATLRAALKVQNLAAATAGNPR